MTRTRPDWPLADPAQVPERGGRLPRREWDVLRQAYVPRLWPCVLAAVASGGLAGVGLLQLGYEWLIAWVAGLCTYMCVLRVASRWTIRRWMRRHPQVGYSVEWLRVLSRRDSARWN